MSLAQRLQRSWWRPDRSALSLALAPLTWLYRLLAAAHRDLYRYGLRPVACAPMPVVVVGNLVAGGAGKTPTVIALVRALRQAGWIPGVISRGYGRRGAGVQVVTTACTASEVGDEPLLIHLRTGAPVSVGRDRVAAAQALCRAHPTVNLLIADDGLQHWRLARDLQVLVFDDRGVGNGCLLPAGPLREALPSHLPPNTLVAYNAPSASTPLPGCVLDRRLGGAVLLSEWWRGVPPTQSALHALRGRPIWAAAGMAHPERFFRMLEAEGLQIERLPLPDHHDFRQLPWPPSASDVLVTEKDAIKLHPDGQGGVRVWVVALDLRLPVAFVAEAQRILNSSSRIAPP
ncbi:MAG: tetraacyldisaccharide 4'-kinase [Pseudomonadota bacterium]